MVLAEGTTNLMQRLARLPKAPHVNTLRRRKPVLSALSHNHHLHIRWCCIDQLRPPNISGSQELFALSQSSDLHLMESTQHANQAWNHLCKKADVYRQYRRTGCKVR